MSFESNFNLIYTVLILPIAVAFQKHFSLKNKVTELETNQNVYMKKVDQMCNSNEKLAKEVNQMLGEWKEHLRKINSS